jgi:betaine reductase
MGRPVIKAVANVLAHVPDVVRYGSKPSREITRDPALLGAMTERLRSWEKAVAYAPHQAFIGNLKPWDLDRIPRPWHTQRIGPGRGGPFGEIVPEDEFYGWLKLADGFDLVTLDEEFAAGLMQPAGVPGAPRREIETTIEKEAALPLTWRGGRVVGCVRPGHHDDGSLSAAVLLENLATKATGAIALERLFRLAGIAPADVEYLLGCGEEAVGDRYQRGGGNIAKAIGEMAGCANASGSDVKAFCCSPVHALVIAGAMVQAGIFHRLVVVGGGALAKLGMKFRGHLDKGLPILEDVLAAVAVLVGEDDGHGDPVIRLDAVGRHSVATGSSPQAIAEALVATPLSKVGLRITDVDRYAVELHNPDITEPAGSGDVPRTNYRTLGALAVLRGELTREELPGFVTRHGMPGFSPTQGHIASAIPFLAHANQLIRAGELRQAMFVAKGSLFLGRMTNLMDGMSVLIAAP